MESNVVSIFLTTSAEDEHECLKAWEATKTCSSSERIRCCTLATVWYASKCRYCSALQEWVGIFVFLSSRFISPGGRMGGSHLHVKDRIKLVQVGGKREQKQRREGGWWVGLILCWWIEKTLPHAPVLLRLAGITAQITVDYFVHMLTFYYLNDVQRMKLWRVLYGLTLCVAIYNTELHYWNQIMDPEAS